MQSGTGESLEYLNTNKLGASDNFVANICTKLLRHLHSAKKINKIIETEILTNDQSLLLFADAIKACIDNGELEREHSVLVVLAALFPFNPQPYL